MDSALMQYVTPELKADPVAWPILDKMSEKDVSAVLKSYANAQHRLGSAINLPSKPEEAEAWRRDHLPKLCQSGVLSAPPTKPEEYGITKPAKLETGIEIRVPLFIKEGEKVKVSTETGEFAGRA